LDRSVLAALVVAAVSLAAAPVRAASQIPDWEALKDVGQIEVITHDEDGDVREATIWFVTVDGEGFIRTGDSTWGENIKRNPADVVLRIEDVEYPMQAEFIESDSLRERVVKAFREKYGWFDGAVNVFRGDRPLIMHMTTR
jgi:hypothetical protein